MSDRTPPSDESLPLAPSSDPMPCRRCGMCCTMHQAFADSFEIERLAEYLNITVTEWEDRYADPRWGFDVYRLVRHIDGHCAFLTRDEHGLAACAVHEVKPACCARWQAGYDKKECHAGMEQTQGENKS